MEHLLGRRFMKSTFIRTFVLAGFVVGSVALANTQTPSTGVNVMPPPGSPTAYVGGGATGFQFVSGEIGVSTNVVKGAPFSLEATVESAQTLADGNRIVHHQEVRLYRDSKGRTRREETLAAIGPWSASGVPPTIITIQDPVSGANYSLDSQHKIATKLPPFPNGKGAMMVTRVPGAGAAAADPNVVVIAGPGAGGGAAGAASPNVIVTEGAGAGPATIHTNPGPMGVFFAGTEGAPSVFVNGGPQDRALQPQEKSESVGKETIAGLPAEGTRTTTTIPANAIGNERPLDIVREQWYSSDLQIVLRSKRTDPRFGDTTYEVTKIDRAEPASNLFEVPSDYKVVKMPAPPPLPTFSDQK